MDRSGFNGWETKVRMKICIRLSTVILWLSSLLVLLPLAHADDRWIEVRSPHFRVMTDGSEQDGRKVAEQFEQMRYVIHFRFPALRLEGNSPFAIVAPRNEASLLRLQPSIRRHSDDVTAEFVASWERVIALVRLDVWNKDTHEPAYYEYVNYVLDVNSEDLPNWLNVGLCEFFGGTSFSDQKISVGQHTFSWATLTQQTVVSVSKLIAPQSADMWEDPQKQNAFRAESWALIHYMTFGTGMEGGRLLGEYYDHIQKGVEGKRAFTEVFGDPAVVNVKFQAYLRNSPWTVASVPPAPPLNAADFTMRNLSAAETFYEQGIFRVDSGNPAEGRISLQKAIELDPKSAAAHEELGYLAYDDGDDAKARSEWNIASEADPTLYRSLFALVKTGVPIRDQTSEQRIETVENLRKVIRANLRYAPAYMELARLFLWQGDLKGALSSAEAGENLEPRRYSPHFLTARILIALGRGKEAASIVRPAADHADEPGKYEMALLWGQIPKVDRGSGPEISFEAPKGTLIQEGRIRTVACPNRKKGVDATIVFLPSGDDSSNAIQVTAKGKARVMWEDTLWVGGRHFSNFSPCWHTDGLPASIAYTPTGDGRGQTLWVDLHEDYPKPK